MSHSAPETRDRLLSTSITATWTYAEGFAEFGKRDRTCGRRC